MGGQSMQSSHSRFLKPHHLFHPCNPIQMSHSACWNWERLKQQTANLPVLISVSFHPNCYPQPHRNTLECSLNVILGGKNPFAYNSRLKINQWKSTACQSFALWSQAMLTSMGTWMNDHCCVSIPIPLAQEKLIWTQLLWIRVHTETWSVWACIPTCTYRLTILMFVLKEWLPVTETSETCTIHKDNGYTQKRLKNITYANISHIQWPISCPPNSLNSLVMRYASWQWQISVAPHVPWWNHTNYF